MHISIERNYLGKYGQECEICGAGFMPKDIVCALECDDSERYHDPTFGYECYRCIELEAEEQTWLLLQRAKHLRRLADQLVKIAAEGITGLTAEDEATLTA